MAGYTRQSLAQILNGEIVSAPPLNAEFNQILAAFNNSTGHKHDGTVAEGPPIDRIADADQNNLVFVDTSANQINFYVESSAAQVGQISIQDGAIVPFTDNDIDLGSSSFEFKDLYIDGTANIDSLVADTADINGGTIDNTVIGATAPAAATFTNLTVSTGGSIDFAGTTITSITSAGRALLDDADASAQRTTLGLGTLATQNANSVAITGGTISGISNLSDPGTSLQYTFSTTTTDSDPGSGLVRLNNATQNAATEIYIDDEDSDGTDVSGVIGLLSGGNNPSSVLGYVTIRKEFAPENFITMKITTLTSASGYTKLVGTVEASSGATPFSDTDNLYFSIDVSGDKGDPGDLSGPASSTDNAIVRWDGTGGNLVQDSGVIIDDSGNVGVGGTSIDAGIHVFVQKNNITSRFERTASGQTLDIFQDSSINAVESTGKSFVVGTTDAQPLLLRTSDTEALRIDSSGSVGIGTTNPSALLDVDGTTRLGGAVTFDTVGEAKYLAAGSITTDRSYDETTERDISLTVGADINIDFETPNSGMAYSHVLWITQDGAGGRTVTIRDGSNVEATWLGTEPTWTGLAPSALTIVSVFYAPSGTLYAAEVTQ